MTEFKLSTFMIAMLLVSGLSIGMYGILSKSIASNAYNITSYDPKYEDRFNKLDTLAGNINNTESELDTGVKLDSDKSFFTGIFDAYRVTKSGFQLATSTSNLMVTSIVEDLGFDSRVQLLIIAILSILVVSALIYLLVGRES